MRKSQYDPGGDVMSRLNNLYKKMIEYYRGNPQQIQHLTKVHSFAKLIGEEEHLDERTLYILEAAAYESVLRWRSMAGTTDLFRSRRVRLRQRR